MPPSQEIKRRSADLLRDPRETLDVEIKGWIDIVENDDHRALLAKALIALANHGGGAVVIGFTRSATSGMAPAVGRPADLRGFTTDTVNAVVTRYTEPPFHCDLEIGTAPDGLTYPIVLVPGGHRFPVRSKRSGPNGQTIQVNTYYIRRPGPQSEAPQSAQEWDDLMRRCLANGREELVNSIRLLLAGGAPQTPQENDLDRVTGWFEVSKARWQQLADALPKDSPAGLRLGHYAVAYQLTGDIKPISAAAMLTAMQGAPRHTGWPPFWVPTRPEIKPYMHDGNIECFLARDGGTRDAGHSDYWRVSPSSAQFFLMRGYQEDGFEDEPRKIKAGTVFDITVPTWRMGEVLLHAAHMSRALGAPDAQVVLTAEWTGLANRELASIGGTRLLFGGHRSLQGEYATSVTVQADQIGASLPELVSRMVTPLYEPFDFFQLPATLVTEEIAKMRSGRF